MINNVYTVGDKLELKAIKSEKDNSISTYTSKIMDIGNNDTLIIAMPMEKGQIIPLSIGDSYEMIAYTKNGLYQCNIEIKDRHKDMKLYILKVQVISKINKYQRRQYFRLDCLVDITYQVMKSENTKLVQHMNNSDLQNTIELTDINESNIADKIKGVITDLSGGGARFTSNKPLKNDDILLIDIFLPVNTMKEFSLECKVISSEPLPTPLGYFEHRVEFVELMKEERESIIKFIFEEERKLIRKGRSQK